MSPVRRRERKVEEAYQVRNYALNQWILATILRTSGIFESNVHSMSGFFFPSVLATLLNLEVPEMLKCVGVTLLPMFGFIAVYRYPDFPMALVVEGRERTNLLTVIQDSPMVPLGRRMKDQIPVMAFCALKSPDELEYNVRQMPRESSPSK